MQLRGAPGCEKLMRADKRWWRLAAAALLAAGCAGRARVPGGYLPPPTEAADLQSTGFLSSQPDALPQPRPALPIPEKPGRKQFDLPIGLPGADATPINPPQFAKD